MSTAEAPQLLVTIESDDPKLLLFQDGRGPLTPICLTPCGKHVARGGKFVLGGEGIAHSESFNLSLPADSVTIKVKTGSATLYRLGFWSATIGGFAIAMGGSYALYGAAFGSDQTTRQGLVGGAIGIVGLVTGLILMNVSGTRFQIESSPATGAI